MKRILLILIIGLNFSVFAQYQGLMNDQSYVGGGAGVTWIDGNPFYTFRVFPEFALGKFGVGLDLKLEVSPEGNLRSENFNTFSDYMSVIRYVRYGHKKDPLYVRVGALDNATLGHGSIMYLYNNSLSYDNRKIGVQADVDFNTFGLETVYSTFGEAGILGVRGFVRPLQYTHFGKIPVIGRIEFGASYVADFNKYADVVSVKYDAAENGFTPDEKNGNMDIWGLDIGLPVFSNKVLSMDLYYDYVNIADYGDGSSVGFILNFNGLGLVDVRTKFERRMNNDQFLPSYFNSMYEIERYSLDNSTGAFISKSQLLKNATNTGNGFYGELLVELLGTFDILGSYQRLDKDPKSGDLHLSTEISPEEMSFIARAGYDKVRIEDESDIFTLDDRSYFFTELGYKPLPYLIVSMVYHWTFTPMRDNSDNVIGYEPQKKIEPRISFVYPIK